MQISFWRDNDYTDYSPYCNHYHGAGFGKAEMRVTEVIDFLTPKELVDWQMKKGKAFCKRVSDEALRVGSLVDSLVQQDIREGGYLVPEGDEPIENCLRAWELFKKDYPEFVPSVLEMQTELRKGDLIGHPDFLHEDGTTDLKCSSSIRPNYWTQTAGYETMRPKFPKFLAILRLDKTTGLYEYKRIEDREYIYYEMKVFDAYLTVYEHAIKNREQIRQMLEEERV